jgi:hypothetical protein
VLLHHHLLLLLTQLPCESKFTVLAVKACINALRSGTWLSNDTTAACATAAGLRSLAGCRC